MGANVPIGRIGTAEEFAAMACFLAPTSRASRPGRRSTWTAAPRRWSEALHQHASRRSIHGGRRVRRHVKGHRRPRPKTFDAISPTRDMTALLLYAFLLRSVAFIDDHSMPPSNSPWPKKAASSIAPTCPVCRQLRHHPRPPETLPPRSRPGPDDIRFLPCVTVRAVYLADFWNRARCDALPLGIDLMVSTTPSTPAPTAPAAPCNSPWD